MSKQNTYSCMYLDIYAQRMFKKLGRYKYIYCVNTLIHVYVRVLIFMEILGCICVSVAIFCQLCAVCEMWVKKGSCPGLRISD